MIAHIWLLISYLSRHRYENRPWLSIARNRKQMFPKKTDSASEMLFSVAGLQATGSCQPSTSNMRTGFSGTKCNGTNEQT